MKYSYEQRLVIVQRVKQGEAIASLSKEYHINETQILAWVRMWDRYGRSGLEKQPHCRPTPALKEKVVRLILEKGVPLAHVRIEYRIGKTALQRWVSMVRHLDMKAYIRKRSEDDLPKTKWHDRKRKNHRQNLNGFRRRICV